MHTELSHPFGRGSQDQKQELRIQIRGRAGNWSRDASLRPNHREGKRWAAKVLQSEDTKAQDTVKQKGCRLPEVLVKVGQDLTCRRSHLPMSYGQAQRQTSSSEQEGRGLDSNLRARSPPGTSAQPCPRSSASVPDARDPQSFPSEHSLLLRY